MSPTTYDPDSVEERFVALPNAAIVDLNQHSFVQPPLSRLGVGPGLILILPSTDTYQQGIVKRLDPGPVQKWAEEGFAVAGIQLGNDFPLSSLPDYIGKAAAALQELPQVNVKDKFGIILYEPGLDTAASVISTAEQHSHISCVVLYTEATTSTTLTKPALYHTISTEIPINSDISTTHRYPDTTSPFFVLPQSTAYTPGNASLAHTRTLVFLRRHLGGPFFDLEAIWEEHTYFEFAIRSVAKTMGTMVAEPYVNHVPTMAGGIGREKLTAFYRDNFIFSNPADATLQPISRTVGPDRVVDEFIFKLTHDRTVDWLLPGIPPTHKRLSIPMMAVVNIRGDRLYHEHIWWDQANTLKQVGLLPTHAQTADDVRVRLPVSGEEAARLLVDETDGKSNVMFEKSWLEG